MNYKLRDSESAKEMMVSNVRILVLQRGWVVVGNYSEEGDECVLTDASVIRRWGTTKGLGQLASGPLADTVLDACGTVRAHKLAVVMQIECPP
jgi:hypothetical protein